MISDNEIIDLIKKAEESHILDYKQDLLLESDGDKADFVKNIIALANSGGIAHIVTGIEDSTWRLVGIRTPHTQEQLNQVLKDKTDPPLRVEYSEKDCFGFKIGVIEIRGDNPPYIVAVPDRYGGPLSANPQKQLLIERGTVYIRNYDINEGARRADLDRMYAGGADIRLIHEIAQKPINDFIEVEIKFILVNWGKQGAASPYIWIQFKNIEQLIRCTGTWVDISHVNNNIPTIRLVSDAPVYPGINMHCHGAIIRFKKDAKQVETRVRMRALNMQPKEGDYVIHLQG